ncbi:hypothetical protein [Nonomuraea typhae]|uniref:Putative metallopeptidase domain-containing protein n=1 Tax=Nonomuraea typhae TaxID=2603600 RepID=A0ABW7YYW5_9ACTN
MRKQDKHDPWLEELEQGWAMVAGHPLFGYFSIFRERAEPGELSRDTWAVVEAHLPDGAYHAACCVAVDRFLRTTRLGSCPVPMAADLPAEDEVSLAERWRREGVPAELRPLGEADFVIGSEQVAIALDHATAFAQGVSRAASRALEIAGPARRADGPWDAALRWFISSYPLLGALATGMTVVAEADLARDWDIAIAAVNPEMGEIYVNPLIRLDKEEWRFVLAHEMLHAALRHGDRTGGREPYLWNVACDYVVNGWLVEMAVGQMPEGLLYDASMKGMSAEGVYDLIAGDLRRLRRAGTLRGRGRGDVLDGSPRAPKNPVNLDEFYRNALSQGLIYHQDTGRGFVPAGLEAAIRALDQPPLPWDAQLARWFDEHVPAVEKRRSYARASRRQASTPHIPRPGWVRPEEVVRQATFGVVLDTSGSMDTRLLGKALGAIASYAIARDVPLARVVFCDAAPYDAGYLRVEEIAGRVRVRGRGGTVLQPGVNLLERAADFPPDGPILLITDGHCDTLRIRREHAFLLPPGKHLPFRARGPIFTMK